MDSTLWVMLYQRRYKYLLSIHHQMHRSFAEFARKKMEKAGVQIILNARVTSATPEGVALADGRFLKGGTIVCTIGNSPAPATVPLNVPKEKGRLVTETDLRLKGCQNLWAIGDCAWIINTQDDQP